MKLRVSTLLRVAVTGAIIYLLVRMVDLGTVWRTLIAAAPGPLALGLALSAGDRLLMFAKWLPLLRARVPGAPVVPAARVYLASGLAQFLLPVTVGADVMRAAAVGRGRSAIPEASASVAAERILGLLASSIMTAVALAIAVRERLPLEFLLPWAACSIIASAFVLLLPFSQKASSLIRRLLHRFWDRARLGFIGRLGAGYAAYRERPGLLLLVGTLSVVEQCFPIALMAVVAAALGIQVTAPMLFVTMPLTLFVTRLPISFGGVGVGDAAIVYLLGLFRMPTSDALAIALLCRAVDLPAMILPGLLLWGDLLRPMESRPGPTAGS